jgi:hypothetical protein
MIKKNFRKVLPIVGILFLLIMLSGEVLMAQGPPAGVGPPQLFITEVAVSSSTLTITGENFDNGDNPVVELGEYGVLTVQPGFTATQIIADCPSSVCPEGEFVLTVSTGSSGNNFDEFDLTIEFDPTVIDSVKDGVDWTEVTNIPAGFADGTDDGVTAETDPVFGTSTAAGITGTDVSYWNTAYGWGDHSSAGYLTSYAETDPTVAASVKDGVDWTEVTNIPAGFADGVDDDTDTTYSPGTGLYLSGTTFNVEVPLQLSGSISAIVKGTHGPSGNSGSLGRLNEGVYGEGSIYGVRGTTFTAIGHGVLGQSAGGNGVMGTSNHGYGVYGDSSNSDGVYGEGSTVGVGVRGYNSASKNSGYLGGINYGVYGSSSSGSAGYFTSVSGYGLIVANGDVGIGTEIPDAKLDVAGDIKFDGQKYCSALIPGNWRNTILVPSSWTATTCANYMTAVVATNYQLVCIFQNNFSLGALNGGIPSPNCGW